MPGKQKHPSASATRTGGGISDSRGPSTPKILQQAMTFESESRKQSQNTQKLVSNEFEKLRRHIAAELKSSAEINASAIRDQHRNLSRLALRSWLWMAISIALVISVSLGALTYTGQRIAANLETIEAQETMIETLRSQGGSVGLTRCEGRLCVPVNTEANQFLDSQGRKFMIIEGH